MKILVFTEGTIIMPKIGSDVSREERVKQSIDNLPEVNDFRSYIPCESAVAKLNNWKLQGADIYYLTSRTKPEDIEDVKYALNKHNFPDVQNLLFRKENQGYKDVAEQLLPDILIEDNCESIGGEAEMTFPHIQSKIKNKIHSIVVKEFAGIENLPDSICDLTK
jgi:hypothetical protein